MRRAGDRSDAVSPAPTPPSRCRGAGPRLLPV